MRPLTKNDLNNSTLSFLWKQVEARINDPEFNSLDLQKISLMSRTSLYRKLTSKVGMSASAFIRHVRLIKASQMLVDCPEMNISEISTAVGFNSLSYFSRRFKETFNICPIQFRERFWAVDER